MITYEDYIKSRRLFPKEEFDEILNSLPDINFDCYDLELDSDYDMDSASREIIDKMLSDYFTHWMDCSCVDWENKSFEINFVENLEDLEEIKNLFNKWKITNYEDIKEELLKEEEYSKPINLKKEILSELNELPLETLETIYNYIISLNQNDNT